jgi:hypothetical protein
MATVVFAGSLHHAVTTPSVYGWAFDGALVGNQNGDDLTDEAVATLHPTLAADSAFSAVAEAINDVEITIDGRADRAWVMGDLAGHTSFVTVRGREPSGANEVAMGSDNLDELGLDLGDTIEVGTGGPDRTMTIVGVVTLPVTGDGGSSNTGLAMRREAADAIGFSGTCGEEAECSRYVAVTGAPGVDLDDAIAPYTSDDVTLARPAPPGSVERLRAVDGLPRVLAAVLGAIAILAVIHAAAVTVRRRRRDLAMLRVLGLSGRQLRRVISVQVVVLALGGATLGVVLGLIVGRLLWGAVAESVPLPVVIAYPLAALLAVPVAVTLLAQVGASWSRRAAGRVRPALALRAE